MFSWRRKYLQPPSWFLPAPLKNEELLELVSYRFRLKRFQIRFQIFKFIRMVIEFEIVLKLNSNRNEIEIDLKSKTIWNRIRIESDRIRNRLKINSNRKENRIWFEIEFEMKSKSIWDRIRNRFEIVLIRSIHSNRINQID